MPLKAAMTGVELLVDRAQLWEQSAARHVSIADQLAAVEALARRWRKFELASWQLLLKQALRHHAEGNTVDPHLACRTEKFLLHLINRTFAANEGFFL